MMHNPSPPHSFLLCLTRTVGLLDNLQRNQIPWFYSSGEMRKQKEIPCPLDSVAGWTSGAALAASTSPVTSSCLVSCPMPPFCSAAGLCALILILPWFQCTLLPPQCVRVLEHFSSLGVRSHFSSHICLCSVLVLPSSGTDLDLANVASCWSHLPELVSQLA